MDEQEQHQQSLFLDFFFCLIGDILFKNSIALVLRWRNDIKQSTMIRKTTQYEHINLSTKSHLPRVSFLS